MMFRKKNREKRKKSIALGKYILFSLFFFLYSFNLFAQDSIPAVADLSEDKELKFQEFFFKALSEKSINNYQKAIENLEECNQLLQNNVTVFFEFSKNYLLLNKNLLAREYIDRALTKEPNNIWMLQHLVEIHKKENAFTAAIAVQERVVTLDESKKGDLVFLYLQDNQYAKANTLITDIEKNQGLSINLKRIKEGLKTIKKPKRKRKKTKNSLENLQITFKENKSFTTLKLIFEALDKQNNFKELEQFSTKGISFFPAQPLVYLTNGKALNNQQKFKEALLILQSGIDFVIEPKMEKTFYKQMAIASKGLNRKDDEKKYRNLAKKLKS